MRANTTEITGTVVALCNKRQRKEISVNRKSDDEVPASKARERKLCVKQGCSSFRVALGRCSRHFQELKLDPLLFAHIKSLAKLPVGERELAYTATSLGVTFDPITGQPATSKWEWEGDQETLAKQYGRRRREPKTVEAI